MHFQDTTTQKKQTNKTKQNFVFLTQIEVDKLQGNTLALDDGGHDVINNFEFPCNSMKNLISI